MMSETMSTTKVTLFLQTTNVSGNQKKTPARATLVVAGTDVLPFLLMFFR